MMPPGGELPPNTQDILRQIYDAARGGDINRLEELARQAAGVPGLDYSTEQWQSLAAEEERQRRQAEEAERQRRLAEEEEQRRREMERAAQRNPLGLLLTIGLILLLAGAAFAGGYFVHSMLAPVPAETPLVTEQVIPTPTFTPSPVVTEALVITAAPAITSTVVVDVITPTPNPLSLYYVAPGSAVYPPIPAGAVAAWMFDERDAIVNPPLDTPEIWARTKSLDKLADQQVSYTTAYDGQIELGWLLDAPLDAGLYEIFILDTQQNSAGTQTFNVLLDNALVTPYRGRPEVVYNTIKAGKQVADAWLSLGVYRVAQGQRLSIASILTGRSKDVPYSLDRLLVTRLSWEAEQLLAGLPNGRVLFSLADDDTAAFNVFQFDRDVQLAPGKQPPSLKLGLPAWGGSFKYMNTPWTTDMSVIWAPQGRLPAGVYELYVWVPAAHATARVSFQLLADGEPVVRDNPAELVQADFSNQWVSMGLWTLPEEAAVSVRMQVSKDANLLSDGVTQAELGVDAVAIVRTEQ